MKTLLLVSIAILLVAGGCATSGRPAADGQGSETKTPTAPNATSLESGSLYFSPADARAQGRRSAAYSRSLIDRGRYGLLDRRMNGYQQAYEASRLGESGLLRAFAPLTTPDPLLEAELDAWIRAFPSSYAAHLARGSYYFQIGAMARGSRTIGKTPSEQLRDMNIYYRKARADLQRSESLTSRPLLTYNVLLRICIYTCDRLAIRRLFDKAVMLDPMAISVRRAYMRSLETRWGGSLEEMLAFMKECEGAGLTAPQLASLNAIIEDERRVLACQEAKAGGGKCTRKGPA